MQHRQELGLPSKGDLVIITIVDYKWFWIIAIGLNISKELWPSHIKKYQQNIIS